MMRTACPDALTLAIGAATAVFVLLSRRNPLLPVAAGALVRVVAAQL
ncbi:MAG: hypothetical protein AB7P02_05565 [Alphaproteobacteria bacterium]